LGGRRHDDLLLNDGRDLNLLLDDFRDLDLLLDDPGDFDRLLNNPRDFDLNGCAGGLGLTRCESGPGASQATKGEERPTTQTTRH
jgi:hypothetical protein